jgi:hypothetical protein
LGFIELAVSLYLHTNNQNGTLDRLAIAIAIDTERAITIESLVDRYRYMVAFEYR